MTTWFTNTNCTQLEIKQFHSVSDQRVQSTVKIDDANFMSYLIGRIEKLPSNGDMMKKLGPDSSFTELVFSCDEGEKLIEIYNDMFKTPSTGFNSGDDAKQQEKTLIRDIHALLQPEIGSFLLKSIGLEYKFKDFSITYIGSRQSPEPNMSSASYSYDLFLIQDNQQQQQIEILSGQLPPQPFDLVINKSKMTLITHQAQGSESLYPYYFMLTDESIGRDSAHH